MLQSHQIDELISAVSCLDRDELLAQFRAFRATFPVDFTREFLERLPIDRLRHLFVGLCIEQQRIPNIAASAA